jgi:hypothetical protein
MNRFRRFLSMFGVVLTLVAALSLSAAGGAHRIVQADGAQEVFAAVWGQSASICGEESGKTARDAGCPVCHLVSAATTPEDATAAPAVDVVFAFAIEVSTTQWVTLPHRDLTRSPRGPPLI